jgi:hypothetical protein
VVLLEACGAALLTWRLLCRFVLGETDGLALLPSIPRTAEHAANMCQPLAASLGVSSSSRGFRHQVACTALIIQRLQGGVPDMQALAMQGGWDINSSVASRDYGLPQVLQMLLGHQVQSTRPAL